MKNNTTYEDAFTELQEIVKEIESGTISVDVLSEKVKRAGELIRFCKEKLFRTEEEVNEVLNEIMINYNGYVFEKTPIELVNYHEKCPID